MRLIEGLMFRYHPQNTKVMEWIREGVVGEVLKFEGCFAYAMPERTASPMRKELGGGALNSSGVYPIAASRMVFGEEPESVFCRKALPAMGSTAGVAPPQMNAVLAVGWMLVR